jgi:formate hydrogenlyase subunit 3/multisubunit Na+/H+ antiporter MnhD subunit
MDIQTITSWLFVATMVLPLVGLPIFIIFNREKTPVETERPSQAAYAWSTVIAAVLGYGVGVSVGTGVSCSPGVGTCVYWLAISHSARYLLLPPPSSRRWSSMQA